MLFDFKPKKCFSLLLVFAMLFSSVRLDSLLVFAHSSIDNGASIIYNLDEVDDNYPAEINVEYVDELDFVDDDLDEQGLEDNLSDIETDEAENIEIDTDELEPIMPATFDLDPNDPGVASCDDIIDLFGIMSLGDFHTVIIDCDLMTPGMALPFFADAENLTIYILNGGNAMIWGIADNLTINMSGGNIEIGSILSSPLNYANVNISGGTVTEFFFSASSWMFNNSTLNISDDAIIQIPLVLDNSTAAMTGGTIETGSGFMFPPTAAAIDVTNGSTFEMTGGTITNNNNGAGVRVTSGTFNMQDGYIQNNYTGVIIDDGTFTMNGGDIQNNNTTGVILNGGTFNMQDGYIQNNHTGVIIDGGTFNMNGGYIQNNGTTGTNINRGGIRINNGTMNMTGGTISGNNAISGGGVHLTNNANNHFTMTGGTIAENEASYGGGVNILGGVFEMTGGMITKNVAEYGGGIYWHPNAIQNMTITQGATIVGNTASTTFLNHGIQALHGSRIQPSPWVAREDWQSNQEHVFNNNDILSHEEQVYVRFFYNFYGAPNGGIFSELAYVNVTNGQPLPLNYANQVLANPPVRADYIFTGWHTDKAGTQPFDFNFPIVGAVEVNIYAGWESLYREVTFNLQGGVAHEAFANQVILHGELATRPTINPERLGHIFIGWYVDNTAFNFTTPIVANTTIYARWSVIQGPGGGGTPGGSGTPPSGGNQPGSGNQPDSGSALSLPQTGLTPRNVLLIGFGLLFGAVVTSHLKKKTSSNDLE